ncbi:MAG: ABC transporter ATP-binding protein [Planctomycetes bacterium]|nr:ABC transporter ATP-binding protein [Planctomycetota bacterium]MCW8136761.1 ABC transporter ATP-binding protein [Planctomycetota bacterium]
MEYALETQGLSKVYKSLLHGHVRALDPLDLQVQAGCVFGLLGGNGAGKSTFVKTVLRICRPTSGSCRILGIDARNPAARQQVGYLPEGTAFPRYLTGRGVCEYFGKLKGLTGQKLKDEVDAKLKLVGMQDWGDRKVTKYSKGMKQRVGLAQALLGDPKLVILDEPTDGVDPAGRHEIRDVIKGLGKSGVTIFLNSHLLAEVEAVCDEIAIMYRGRLLRRGPVKQITEEMSIRDGRMQLRFRTSELPAELPAIVNGAERDDGGFKCSVANRDEIPALIDALRGSGVRIYEVEQYHASLEEAFLQILEDGHATGVGGRQ